MLRERIRGDRPGSALRPVALADAEVDHLSKRILAHIPLATALLTPELRVRAWDLSGIDVENVDADFDDIHVVELPWWREDEKARWFVEGAARRALSGEAVQFEGTYSRHSDGSPGTMWFRIAPFRENDDADVSGVVVMAQDMTDWARDRETAKAAMSELAHRVKNMLALVSSIVNLNLRKATTLKDAQDRIGQRLGAYGRAQDLIFQEGLHDVRLSEVLDQALVPFPRSRVDLEVSDGVLGSRTALVVGLALHELGMNAVKYGAWSNSEGRVRLVATGGRTDELTLMWEETGGPPVSPPQEEGFGSTLTNRVLRAQTRGEVSCDYRPEGLLWKLTAKADA